MSSPKQRRGFPPFRSLDNSKNGKGEESLEQNLSSGAYAEILYLSLELAFGKGVNFNRRSLLILGEINESTFRLVDATLTEMEDRDDSPITIKINSPGGDMEQAAGIVGRIQETKNTYGVEIITHGYGIVASAACFVLASGTKRELSRDAMVMFHESSYAVEGGHAKNVAFTKMAAKQLEYWTAFMGRVTKKNKKFWTKELEGEDKYYPAKTAKRLGIVDTIF